MQTLIFQISKPSLGHRYIQLNTFAGKTLGQV